MIIEINLIKLLLIWFVPGLVWSLFFTGIYVRKAIVGHRTGQLKSDTHLFTIWILIVMFLVSWVAWPWSVGYNLPYIIRR